MRTHRGFTLIELMIAIAIVAILTAIALPSYRAYVLRSRTPVALDALQAFATRMEQRYQDVGNYGTGTSCGVATSNVANFTISCSLTNSGQGFTATATGGSSMVGYAYSINEAGTRATTAHPNGTNSSCWTTKGKVCDT